MTRRNLITSASRREITTYKNCGGGGGGLSIMWRINWDSSVGVATRYGLEGPKIESRWGHDFPHQSTSVHPASYTVGTGSFPGVKRPGRGVDHPPQPRVEVKERVELYLYSPSGSSWPVLGWTLTLPLLLRLRDY